MSASPPTLARRVLDELGRSITMRQRPPGTVLRIEDLQVEFGVSRTVVRDALRSLESMHLVRNRRRVGVTVRPPSDWSVFAPDVVRWRLENDDEDQMRSFVTLRLAVEPVAASLAAASGQPSLGAQLVELADAMTSAAGAGDLDLFLTHDLRFHSLILRSCGNEMFAALDEVTAEVLRARHEKHLMPRRPRDLALLLHRLVAVAVRDGDATGAETAMRQIVAEVQSVVSRLADADPEAVGHGGGLRPASRPVALGEPKV